MIQQFLKTFASVILGVVLKRPAILNYKLTLVVVHLGWVDLDMGSSPGCSVVIVAAYCPRMVEHLKCKLTQPRCTTTRVTLYCKWCRLG